MDLAQLEGTALREVLPDPHAHYHSLQQHPKLGHSMGRECLMR